MQTTPGRDLAAGIFVLLGLAALAWLSVQVGGATLGGPGGLRLVATFDEIGGLTARAPVVISGVKVGRVERIGLGDYLRAQVVFQVNEGLELPVDTRASIRTSGLLGDQYLALEPGAEDELLGNGDEIAFTESALMLEKLVGQLVHNVNLGDGQ